MKNIRLAALTVVLLTALSLSAQAGTKDTQTLLPAERVSFSETVSKIAEADENVLTVQVDYIVDENGKVYVTYISPVGESLRNEVLRRLESAQLPNAVAGKVYSVDVPVSNPVLL